jgi:hypothetical protein
MAKRAAAPGPLGEVTWSSFWSVVRNRDRFARPDGPPVRAEEEFDLALEDLEHLDVVRMDVCQRFGAAVGEPELHDDRVAGPARALQHPVLGPIEEPDDVV